MKLLIPLLCLIPGLAWTAPTYDGLALTTQVVASNLDQPLFVAQPPGDHRLFVVEKTGRIRILEGGGRIGETFLNISTWVNDEPEGGLLGLAFSPGYATDHHFYVYYTDPKGSIHLVQMTAQDDHADPASAQTVLDIPHPGTFNHNAGWLGFGPDGYLYVTTGDGGNNTGESQDADGPWKNAQTPDVLLGKVLRIDVTSLPYAIPPDNPFAKGGGAPEVFFLGLRNPWRASFDGDLLYIGDVGQENFEEVDVTALTPGLNFGWNRIEGNTCTTQDPKACDTAGLVAPVVVYSHDDGCSVIGGYVYRGAAMPALQGRYFYSDYCNGKIMSFRYRDGKAEDPAGLDTEWPFSAVTGFGQDAAGEIYVTLGADGQVLKLVPAAN
jgi:glucose/arabinose dehydrogenase